MSAAFEDITIVDLDLPKTTWSRVHSAMRTLYLKLSREPALGWVRFFHEEREARVVIKRHGLWIEDDYIVFDCLLEDVEKHHLPDFRLSVDYANHKYREFLATRREEGEQIRDDARQEQRELAALRKRIRQGRGAAPTLVAMPSPLASKPTPSANRAATLAGTPATSTVSTASARAALPPPSPPAKQAANEDNREISELDAKREEWRARFRAALASRPKEPARGND